MDTKKRECHILKVSLLSPWTKKCICGKKGATIKMHEKRSPGEMKRSEILLAWFIRDFKSFRRRDILLLFFFPFSFIAYFFRGSKIACETTQLEKYMDSI